MVTCTVGKSYADGTGVGDSGGDGSVFYGPWIRYQVLSEYGFLKWLLLIMIMMKMIMPERMTDGQMGGRADRQADIEATKRVDRLKRTE